MSDYMKDLRGIVTTGLETASSVAKHSTNKKAGTDMQMDDYLKLMVATFQNQSIDDVASTSDMVNQMVQMSVIQTITSLNKIVSESSSMTYAASLVGKEVTIGQRVGDQVSQLVGKVTGTGMLDGEQVIFLGEDVYKISDVIAIGTMPGDAAAQAQGVEAPLDGPINSPGTLPKQETVRRVTPKVGRNDKCPCGSGKKYKNCCGREV